jgi:restriction system protein
MPVLNCPACGSPQELALGVCGFRCRACQRDAWIIRCHRCSKSCVIFGSATGAGALSFQCASCRGRNVVQKQVLRSISAEGKRLERAVVAARRDAAAREKAVKARHLETRAEEVARQNGELQRYVNELRGILASSLASNSSFSFAALRIAPNTPTFSKPTPPPQPARQDPPQLASFLPRPRSGLTALVPGARARHEHQVQVAEAGYQQAQYQYQEREAQVQQEAAQYRVALATAEADFAKTVETIEQSTREQNAAMEELERRFKEADPDAVVEYFTAVFDAMSLPYESRRDSRIAFSPQSRQLAVEFELPSLAVVPEVRGYVYVKTRDETTTLAMPVAERKALYTLLLAELALRTIHECFRADDHRVVETIVFNGHVQTVDRRTGQEIHPCLITVRTTRDRFGELNLGQVDPTECLKGLNASVSRSPGELVPVRPVIEFDMVDPRFVKEAQVLATLDTRPNLMELSPSEFESLITNLFEKMGLETKLTQPSRDGGVDCVAYDPRPIFGGKVVVQAKRYKNTVGVSAVRDLFGTMQNEGATKGILVTTSGYGQASHDFANGKPLELIDGANLLYLLQEYAEVIAKIEVPEDWTDPEPDQ